MSDFQNLRPDGDMLELVAALKNLRDSWMSMSLLLRDKLIEIDSSKRDEVIAEVERYLTRLSESKRRPGL